MALDVAITMSNKMLHSRFYAMKSMQDLRTYAYALRDIWHKNLLFRSFVVLELETILKLLVGMLFCFKIDTWNISTLEWIALCESYAHKKIDNMGSSHDNLTFSFGFKMELHAHALPTISWTNIERHQWESERVGSTWTSSKHDMSQMNKEITLGTQPTPFGPYLSHFQITMGRSYQIHVWSFCWYTITFMQYVC